ncbi:MAG: dihydrodipicolinate synthase family protein [Candidatus Thermoplasmatota archaeon]|jgi:4-hydroxy-tetrahydrodipicolinate synthase/2-dehydro-3-deoxy-D-gluconate aldolase|nr:dihydrodipicolinate synthase family protein [Candidatus Thermoplasmatota archaeon]
MKYKGIITPMLTPFTKAGSIDYAATETLLDFLRSIKVHGVFPLGSTGVFNWLETEERKKFLEFVIEHSKGMKVFAGVGASGSYESVKLARHARDAGADVLVLMPTYYIKPDQNYILNHMNLVFGKIDADFFIYNIPQFVGEFISVQTIESLIKANPNVVGIKESSGDMRYFSRLIRFSGKEFSVIQGQDDLLLPSLSIGADGGVCGTTNFSDAVVDLYGSFMDGNYVKSREIQVSRIDPMMEALALSPFPEAYYAAFYTKNKLSGGYREPMGTPSDKVIREVGKYLSDQ